MGDFKIGNSAIANLYYGNISVAAVYYGNQLIWQASSPVPYDNTCTATITLNQDKTAWIVTVTKDGEDVTSSLSQITTWIYDKDSERIRPYTVDTNIIDLSQKPRGEYRVDLAQITSKAGGYFPGTGSISVPEHIYIGQLVAGDQLVAIEYVPSADTTVQSIEIYTTSNQGDNNKARVKILHESGLYIAAFNSDNGPDAAEIYHLSGYKRYVNNQNVSLKAGKKYYIVYQHDDADPGENTFWPAYFDGENGNYKEYSNNRDTVTTTDITNLGTYAGEVSDLSKVVPLSENDFFVWEGSNSIFEQHACYIRSSAGNGKTYKGEIGDSSTYATITKTDIQTWLGLSENDSYWWHVGGYHNLTRDYFYYKKATPTISQIDMITGSNNDTQKLVALFRGIQNNKGIVIDGPQYWYGINAPYTGLIFELKSGYTVRLSTDTQYDENTLPSDAATNDIFLIANGAFGLWNNNGTVAVCTNNGGTITMTAISDVSTITNISYIDTYMTEIGNVGSLQKQKISGDGVISNTLRSATLGTTRKYYLKINGKEV